MEILHISNGREGGGGDSLLRYEAIIEMAPPPS